MRDGGRGSPATALAAAAVLVAGAAAAGQPASDAPPPLGVELRAERVGFTLPGSVEIRLTRPAHVAVFEVRPGVGTVLRHPAVRDAAGPVPAGTRRLPLAAGRRAFDRAGDLDRLPARGRLAPPRPRDLGRPYLLVVASADPLWLSRHRLGRVFRPRDARLPVAFLVDAVLRDVLPHPERRAWAFDLRPGLPRAASRPARHGLAPLHGRRLPRGRPPRGRGSPAVP